MYGGCLDKTLPSESEDMYINCQLYFDRASKDWDNGGAIQNGSYIFKEKSGYGNLLYIGQQNDYPIFTLTNESDNQMETKPSADYLKTIYLGIKQTHGFDDRTILHYLKNKRGIIGNYTCKSSA